MGIEKREIERLYEAYQQKMIRLAWMILGNKQEAEDVVGEVFSHMLEKGKTMPQAEEGYLMMAVRNRCANVIAHKSVKERVTKLIGDAQCTEPQTARDERLEEIAEFVRHHLSPLTQRIFQLRYIMGMSYQEIADATGVSKVTVYNHLSEAVDKARAHFKQTKTL